MVFIGRVSEIFRYPVKSLAGVPTDSAELGWNGLHGDRRFAFRRVGVESGFPWLTASKLPELILYQTEAAEGNTEGATRVRTPEGAVLPLGSTELNAEVTARYGSAVDMMRIDRGIFDEASVSLITKATIAGVGREAGLELDRRRFRANLIVETESQQPFVEDGWLGRTLAFGEETTGPAVLIMMRDTRCVMINLDPDSASPDPRVLKTVARINDRTAGVYATVLRTGLIRVGDRVALSPPA